MIKEKERKKKCDKGERKREKRSVIKEKERKKKCDKGERKREKSVIKEKEREKIKVGKNRLSIFLSICLSLPCLENRN